MFSFTGYVIIDKPLLVTVVQRQAFAGAHPYSSGTVHHNAARGIAGDTGRVAVRMTVHRKVIAIEFIQSIGSGKPHIAFSVLIDGKDRTVRQTVFLPQMIKTKSVAFGSNRPERKATEQGNEYPIEFCFHKPVKLDAQIYQKNISPP